MDSDNENGTSNDASQLLKKQVCVSNDGQLKIFGKEFDVGPQFATILRPLVTTLLNEVSLRGASTAARKGAQFSGLIMPKQLAAKVGKGIGFVWLFGLSASDVLLGVKKTVRDGYKEMHDLRDKWQPLLAANNNMDVAVGKALTCDCGVFAHARAKVYENAKRNLLATVSGSIRALPNIIMGIYQHQLNNIQNTDHALASMFSSHIVEMHKSGGTAQNAKDSQLLKELAAVEKSLLDKKSKGDAKPLPSGKERDKDDVIGKIYDLRKDHDFSRRMLHPKNEDDYQRNINDLKYAPALFDLGGGLIERQINKKTQNSGEDAGDKILALQSFIHNHDDPDRDEVVTRLKDIFQQRAKDLGKAYTLEGDTYDRMIDAVTDAVIAGLHPQAVAEALDNKKVVSFGKKDADFGESSDVNKALDTLKAKYTRKVNEKQFYKDAPFTKESLAKTFKEIPEKEKPFFVMLFPPMILENSGIDKTEVKKYREKGKEIFVAELTGMTKSLMESKREDLKKYGVKSKAIDEFESFKDAFQRAEDKDRGDSFLEKGTTRASRVVRDIILSAKSPRELWQEHLKKRKASESAVPEPAIADKAKDHPKTETGEGAGIPSR